MSRSRMMARPDGIRPHIHFTARLYMPARKNGSCAADSGVVTKILED